MIKKDQFNESALRHKITANYHCDESECIEQLIEQLNFTTDILTRIQDKASELVAKVREKRIGKGGLDAFLYQYDLSTEEGIALMCLAEALLRVPDADTADKLIKDKIQRADWHAHAGKSDSTFVNAATWGLMLTGKVFQWNELSGKSLSQALKKLAGKSGEPVIRKTASYAMKILGKQFVMGRTIQEALKRAKESESKGYCYSYDMLGEAARTEEDAKRYYRAYQEAIHAIGAVANNQGPIRSPGVSVKLSALHPRYEFAQQQRVLDVLVPRLLKLAQLAKQYNIGLTVDAEEADRLDLSLDIIEQVFSDPSLQGWEGFGLAVQSYQKRALPVLHWLQDLAKKNQRRLMVRLIKGAYWDSEIKHSQENGLEDYPVFTRKVATDVSFLACAQFIADNQEAFYPQFATHNAYSVAAILQLMGDSKDYEFQCLHGMGQTLYDEVVGEKQLNVPCRIYAPVGSHEDLLAYLVRRLLENGANSSFVNRIVDEKAPISDLVKNPVEKLQHYANKPHPGIPLPEDLYGVVRKNSRGIDLTCRKQLRRLAEAMELACAEQWQAGPLINGKTLSSNSTPVVSPANQQQVIGQVSDSTLEHVEQALAVAADGFRKWDATAVTTRAQCLRKMADLLQENAGKLIAILCQEAGKTLADGVAEVREAVDFCRYYAWQGELHLGQPQELPGPTGEINQLSLHGRGTILCISPWNFPLAIFLGQISAALMAGNTVIAKPAEQTPLIAQVAIQLLLEAGVPACAIQLLPGPGETIGAQLVADQRIKGVMFTGSTETARLINQTLANRGGPIVPLIAETGGQNAMLVDSTALAEQAVQDIVVSAFGSAGQRCSALRVLFVQEDIADRLLTMLKGSMAELKIGEPGDLSTDVGPVIDEQALQNLKHHEQKMTQQATLLYKTEKNAECAHGFYFEPIAFELADLSLLEREVFGPVLHVIRFAGKELDQVLDSINSTGYGLTLGIHTRIEEKARYITERGRVGNSYINRAMTGAVVGVQPFGGEGLSGTGPKAGGPHYLLRLVTERTLSIDTTAAGGNATLMSLGDDD